VLTEVADEDQAVSLANKGRYGLGASVFSRSRGGAIARRLDAGMVSINAVLPYAGSPGLPWGGSKDSGFGRIHGPDGLREFARSRVITSRRFDIPLRLTTFERSRGAVGQLKQLARLRWGRG
jgi:aldehyde dehydrogenase (NAD+)